MIAKTLILLYCLLTAADAGNGTVSGIVVNASSAKTPVSGAEVVLRAEVHGESLICGETTSDEQGRFVFHDLPQGEAYWYLPGANRDGVHFPGARLQLTAKRPRAEVEISVCDSISAPSPLLIRRQEVSLRFQAGALTVTESIVVDNPSQRCYVGATPAEGGEPVTLQLAIPSDFERITFQTEFFGRRFYLLNGKLATGIPWPPGRRELKFTYVLPVQQGIYLWQRPLDLPCEQLRLSIETAKVEDISCNLARASSETASEAVYQSHGEILPKGHVIRLEMGHMPVPFMVYARWSAVALLLLSFCIGGGLVFKRLRNAAGHRSPIDTQKSNISSKKTPRRDRRVKNAA
jgi:hypothetical protein